MPVDVAVDGLKKHSREDDPVRQGPLEFAVEMDLVSAEPLQLVGIQRLGTYQAPRQGAGRRSRLKSVSQKVRGRAARAPLRHW